MENLRDIEPYVPGEQSKEQNIVKINANENPYPPSPKAIEAIKNFECGNAKIILQWMVFIWYVEQPAPYRIKAVGNIRVNNRFSVIQALSLQKNMKTLL